MFTRYIVLSSLREVLQSFPLSLRGRYSGVAKETETTEEDEEESEEDGQLELMHTRCLLLCLNHCIPYFVQVLVVSARLCSYSRLDDN